MRASILLVIVCLAIAIDASASPIGRRNPDLPYGGIAMELQGRWTDADPAFRDHEASASILLAAGSRVTLGMGLSYLDRGNTTFVNYRLGQLSSGTYTLRSSYWTREEEAWAFDLRMRIYIGGSE